MSDLWDYDDDDSLDNGDTWKAASPDIVAEVEESSKKRKPGRKQGKSAKRRAGSPAAAFELRPAVMPTTILLDSDDEDDLVLLTSPDPDAKRAGAAIGNMRAEVAPVKAAVANLNPATQESLAKEQALLRALQEVTDRADQPDDDMELTAMPSVSAMPHLTVSRLHSRLPLKAAVTSNAPVAEVISDDDDDGVLAADFAAATSGAATAAYDAQQQIEHNGSGPHEAGGGGGNGDAPTSTPAPAADRVQLKLVWGRDKDESIKMRVVKSDPFSKMIEKFRDIAKQRNLCRDPKKIKFLFDGDDLAKMPSETPESLDMDDDMMIDVKL